MTDVMPLDVLLEWARDVKPWQADRADVTDDRERYTVSYGDAMQLQHWITDRQWECQRPAEQYVFANESERLLLIETFIDYEQAGARRAIPRFHLEVWTTVDGYEDRLDELAGVTVEALA